jgi:hypothetical protein
MRGSKIRLSAALILLAVVLSCCATTHPVDFKELRHAGELTPNTGLKKDHMPFVFSSGAQNWGRYHQVLLDQVELYHGADNQFGAMSNADKAELAAFMRAAFSDALKTRFVEGTASGPNALRVHLVLTGAQSSVPVIATVSKLLPVALLVNTVQTVRDKPAAFSGSVSYAVEIYDAASNKLLRAYVAEQYPKAENVLASFGTLDACKVGIAKGADDLLTQLL